MNNGLPDETQEPKPPKPVITVGPDGTIKKVILRKGPKQITRGEK